MSRYIINVLASQDLNAIADYFAENNLEAGERFFSDFNCYYANRIADTRQGLKSLSNKSSPLKRTKE